MRTLLIALLLACCPAWAQVSAVCGPSPVEGSRAVFVKRVADGVQHWSCVVRNAGAEPVLVSWADVQGFMLRNGVTALSHAALDLAGTELKRRGAKATIGRVFSQVAFVAAGAVFQDPQWAAIAMFSAANLPRFGEAIARRDPADANLSLIAMDPAGVTVQPRSSASVEMFAIARKGAEPVMGPLFEEAPLPEPALELSSYRGGELWAMAYEGGQRLAGRRR